MSISPFSQTFEGTPYTHKSFRTINGRGISKYLLDNTKTDALEQAIVAIENLLKRHTNLIPTFSTDAQALRATIEQNNHNYLIINGRAVSLAPEGDLPDRAEKRLLDNFFSENILEKPIKCQSGHYFEKSRVEFWIKGVGLICPVGEDHALPEPDRLVIDDELTEEITRVNKIDKEQKDFNECMLINQTVQNLENLNAKIENEKLKKMISENTKAIEKIPIINPITAGGAIVKIGFKAGAKEVTYFLSKAFAKQLTEEGTRLAAKKLAGEVVQHTIPIFSVIMGIGLCAYRFRSLNQRNMAGFEMLSGAVTHVPGFGLLASTLIDVGLIGCDLFQPFKAWYYCDNKKEKVVEVEVELTIDLCYALIGINTKDCPNPTKDQVEAVYKLTIRRIHPDNAIALKVHRKETLEKLTQLVNFARDRLYQLLKW